MIVGISHLFLQIYGFQFKILSKQFEKRFILPNVNDKFGNTTKTVEGKGCI